MAVREALKRVRPYVLASKKQGKQEVELHPIPKVELPLDTYHVDHIGPLESTNKNYKHILCVIDSFTKFVWLYPTKSTSNQEVISKLELQKSVFGNPRRTISDKGSAFNSKEFDDYCSSKSIQHLSVTTGLPRANGQVERLNSTIFSRCMPVLLPEPGQEGRLWATSRVPADGATIASDDRISNCREQKTRRTTQVNYDASKRLQRLIMM
ncbi:Pro-Pol polyprotein [Araneus ventricosus]|uniref:Pro-Pol polyprotein n=1 Tax=Araneus ventricosus TaxID=182803 RepID=A0A4Y2AN48_ARAVE|nr:Pro-Pol polyprotein [Araneus ventricosus]